MSNATTSSEIATEQTPYRLTNTLPRATVTAGFFAAAVTTTGAGMLRAAGVPLSVHGEIPLAGFAQFTFIGAVLGGILLAVLIRRNGSPHRSFIGISAGLTALSSVVPAIFAETTASKIALVTLHLLAAAIIIPMLARRAI